MHSMFVCVRTQAEAASFAALRDVVRADPGSFPPSPGPASHWPASPSSAAAPSVISSSAPHRPEQPLGGSKLSETHSGQDRAEKEKEISRRTSGNSIGSYRAALGSGVGARDSGRARDSEKARQLEAHDIDSGYLRDAL